MIKSWLPAAAVKKIKFLTKSNLSEFVKPDQALVAWGGESLKKIIKQNKLNVAFMYFESFPYFLGTDDWEYSFEEEPPR